MTYERFLKVVSGLQKEDRVIKQAYDIGVDMINFVDPYHSIIHELIAEVYGEQGLDWFTWFCWENDFGQGDLMQRVNDGSLIRHSTFSLWEYLEENHKKIKHES